MKAGRTNTGKIWHAMGDDRQSLCGRALRWVTRDGDALKFVDCQQCLARLGVQANEAELAPIAAYAKARGWRFRVQTEQMLNTQAHAQRTFRANGRCEVRFEWGRLVGTKIVVLVAPGSERFGLMAAVHEAGHAEAFEEGGYRVNDAPMQEKEIDAWERGLRIAGELGIPVGSEEADFALACLASYRVTSGRLVEYLWSLTEWAEI
jgi:hypothetical protein